MASRRTRGSVRRLPSGRWQVRYTAPDGQRRSAEHTYSTKADATKALSLIDTAIIRGSWVDPKREVQVLGPYAERWIQERPGLSPRTVELYSGLLRRHIRPRLGGHLLHAITPGDIRSWRQHLLTAGVGPTTVAQAYRLLRAIMATAVDDELIPKNPCRIKGASVEHTPERPVRTLQESFGLADAIEQRYRALVLLAVFGSLRWGELMGLTRADVDLVRATVHVRRSVAEVASKLVVKEPKSQAGVRSIALPQWIVPELEKHLEQFAEPGAVGRLFVGVKGSTPRRGHWTKTWRAAKRKAGVPEASHFPDLRHTGNHLAAASGASTRELTGRMGHASMRAALIYQHRTADRDRLIADALDVLIDAAQSTRKEPGKGDTATMPWRDWARRGHDDPLGQTKAKAAG